MKDFLQLLLSKVCGTFLFRQSKKFYCILWFVRVFFQFLDKRRPNRYWSWEENLIFHMKTFSLTCQSVNLFSKMKFLMLIRFLLSISVVDTKLIYGYNVVALVRTPFLHLRVTTSEDYRCFIFSVIIFLFVLG